jgi:CO dehydrogenase maturation factor
MSCRIAIAGKGGTGKTTLAALITTCLLKAGKTPVLAVDADPNANLNEALGVAYDTTVVDTVDQIMGDGAAVPAGVTKRQLVEYQMHDALVESAGFDLLVMGRTEGPGCYCHANDLLREFLEKLSGGYSHVVMDNEAGMEHLSRRTTRNVDVLLIAANPTVTAVRSAGRIHEIARKLKLGVGRSCLVLNRLNGAVEPPFSGTALAAELASLEAAELRLLGEVPYDEQVMAHSMEARGILGLPADSAALGAVGEMMAKLGL